MKKKLVFSILVFKTTFMLLKTIYAAMYVSVQKNMVYVETFERVLSEQEL